MLDGLRALNDLGGEGRVISSTAPLSGAQKLSVQHLRQLYHSVGRSPASATPERAWNELIGTDSGYCDVPVRNVKTYQRGLVKLPPAKAQLAPLVD